MFTAHRRRLAVRCSLLDKIRRPLGWALRRGWVWGSRGGIVHHHDESDRAATAAVCVEV